MHIYLKVQLFLKMHTKSCIFKKMTSKNAHLRKNAHHFKIRCILQVYRVNVVSYGVDDGKKRMFIKSVVISGVIVQSNDNAVICFEQCLRHIII